MTDLPSGWEWARLDDLLAAEERPITDGPFGSKLTSRHYTPSGARVIRLQNIGEGVFRDEEAYISDEYFQELRAHEALPGDLLIASLGDQLPRACVLPDLGARAIVKADCIRARIHPEMNSSWVLYALMSPCSRRYAAEKIKGVGRQRLGLAGIRGIPVPIPPREEQHRIVAALEDYLHRLAHAEASIETARIRIAKLISHARNEIYERFSTSLVPLSAVLSEPLVNGRSVPTKAGGFPVLRLTALRSGYLDLRERKEGLWGADEAEPFRVRSGDFFISRGNGSLALVGRGALLVGEPDPVAFPDTMIRIRVSSERVMPEFLQAVWDSRQIRSQIESGARTTAGIYKINQKLIGSIMVPAPSLTEQREAVERLGDLSEQVARVRELIDKAWKHGDHLRRSLLAQAFRGRLVSQNQDDLAASALLEKIGAERALVRSSKRGVSRTRSGVRGGSNASTSPPQFTQSVGTPVQETLL